jgi:plastocyanin
MRLTTRFFVFGLSLIVAGGCGGDSGGGGPIEPSNQTGSVRGSVLDHTGAGVATATVQLVASGKTTRNTTTGADGGFSFSNVSTGAWQVVVVAPAGYSGGSNPIVTVTANQEATVPVITLTKLQAGGTPTAASVIMYLNAFVPADVTVKAGGTVTWRNTDSETHNATGNGIDTGNLTTNASSTRTFASVGTFNYACTLHAGMVGTVRVVQ